MICDAKIFVERLLKNKTITEKDILEMEVYVRKGCSQMKACEDALNVFLVRRDFERKAVESPTIQEQDRRAAKKSKWWRF